VENAEAFSKAAFAAVFSIKPLLAALDKTDSRSPCPRFHPISPKVTHGTQASAEGRNPTSYASISVVKELALYLQKAYASLYRILFAHGKCLSAW
jgi:hypothetical protein